MKRYFSGSGKYNFLWILGIIAKLYLLIIFDDAIYFLKQSFIFLDIELHFSILNTKTLKYSIILLAGLLVFSCSTEKNTMLTRGYHSLTSYYNIYFNGNESLKEGLYKIDNQVEEDYTKILPIFKESMSETETLVGADMDRAIEKATKLIKMHSITAPPESNRKQKNPRKRKPIKEDYNRVVDDAYLLMGRAYLYKKEYFLAANTFSLLIRKFKDEPIKYDAYIWLIRTYNESERYTEANELIEMLEADENLPEEFEGELAVVAADMHLKQLHNSEAIQFLNIGAKKIKGNKRKTRYNFILGQLYQEQGNSEKALEAYQRVIRRRPDYEMMFNARINSASVYSGDGDVAGLRRELSRMLKKKRNEPFFDQIYYALGNILYNEGKIDDAVNYYKQSVSLSVSNTYQRALSCITLAEIYFDKREYIPSGQYYDSAMVLIDENYPNYPEIEQKYQSLSGLVDNLLTVQTQDSLQYLAGLPESALNSKIEEWIAIEKQRFASLDDVGSTGVAGAYMRTGSRVRRSQGGGWYFYNPSTVAYGKQEFKRLWGDRKNEDDWRRSNKSVQMFDEFGELVGDEFAELIPEEEVRIDDPTTKEYYMQDIPTTDSLMAASHEKIKNALFDAGARFKNDFNDFEKSIEMFNELNKRYPDNNYQLPAYFNLWDLHAIVEQADSSRLYKNKILNEYPQSNYAKYLINPNFFIEEEARNDSLNSLYALAFDAFNSRNFGAAKNYSSKVLSMQPDSLLKPKARFIEMVSASRGYEQKRFADSLRVFVHQYKGYEPVELAQQILDLIDEEKLTNYDELISSGYLSDVIKNLEVYADSDDASSELVASKWDSDSDLLHYFVVAFPNTDSIDINRLRFDIANYNIDHYTTLDFDIDTELLNSDTRLVLVRSLSNKDAALIYFLSIIRKAQVFKSLAGQKFLNFVVSSSNYREMMADKSYNKYLSYFVKNYSIHTTGEFPEEDLESPEELIARLSVDPNEELEEKGEFVELDIDESEYDIPEPKEQIYTLDYEAGHMFMIYIDEPRANTGFMMRDFVRYNSSNMREYRLRVVPNNMSQASLLLVSQFNDALQALEYMQKVSGQNQLFESLGETPYETFVISPDNLAKLKETGDIDEFRKFYRLNYVRRKPPVKQQDDGKVETETESKTEQQNSVETTSETPSESESVNAGQTQAGAGTVPDQSKQSVQPDTVVQQSANDADEAVTQPETAPAADEPAEVTYSFEPEKPHKLVYVLPRGGSNQKLLVAYLGRLNAVSYGSNKLTIDTETFDDYSVLVVIKSFENKSLIDEYLKSVDADSRIAMSLRNIEYKKFIISENNYRSFVEANDLKGYLQFYSEHYQ